MPSGTTLVGIIDEQFHNMALGISVQFYLIYHALSQRVNQNNIMICNNGSVKGTKVNLS